MIVLDLLSGMVVLGYLVEARSQSLSLFYTVTIVCSALVALYYPSTMGIVPLLLVNVKWFDFGTIFTATQMKVLNILEKTYRSITTVSLAQVTDSRIPPIYFSHFANDRLDTIPGILLRLNGLWDNLHDFDTIVIHHIFRHVISSGITCRSYLLLCSCYFLLQ